MEEKNQYASQHSAKACERMNKGDRKCGSEVEDRRNKWQEKKFATLQCVDWAYSHTDFGINVSSVCRHVDRRRYPPSVKKKWRRFFMDKII